MDTDRQTINLDRQKSVLNTDRDTAAVVDLNTVFNTVWRRKRIVFVTMLIVVALLTAVIFSITPRYTATASIVVEPQELRTVAIESVAGAISGDGFSLQTQLEILRSRELAYAVVDRLDLDSDPEFFVPVHQSSPSLSDRQIDRDINGFVAMIWADIRSSLPNYADWLPTSWSITAVNASDGDDPIQRQAEPDPRAVEEATSHYFENLRVVQAGQSRVISVSFTSSRAERAAEVANSVMEIYVERQLGGKVGSTEIAISWLEDRVEKLRTQVIAAEEAVESYRVVHNLPKNFNEAGPSDQTLTSLRSDLNAARIDLVVRVARHKRALEMVGSGAGYEALAEFAGSSSITNELRAQELTLSREQTQLSEEYGSNHPRIIDLRAQQQNLARKIDQEANNILERLSTEVEVAEEIETDLQDRLTSAITDANAAGEAAIQMRELQRDAAAKREVYETTLTRYEQVQPQTELLEADATVISRAVAPSKPSFPQTKLILIAGFIGSGILGLFLIALREHLDRGIRSGQQVEALLGLPNLALIPRLERAKVRMKPHRYLLEYPLSAYADAIKSAEIAILGKERDPQTIMVTSARPSEGKTTFAMSLSASLAHSGARTLVVDFDFRHPSIRREIDSDPPGTLKDYLRSLKPLDEVIVEDSLEPRLHIMTCETGMTNPASLCNARTTRELLADLKNSYQFIVIDCPPALGFSETKIIADFADRIAFVIQWSLTVDRAVANALNALEDHRAKIVGTVLTQVDIGKHAAYGYYDSGQSFKEYSGYYANG